MTSIKWNPTGTLNGLDSGLARVRDAAPGQQSTIPGVRERTKDNERARTALTLARSGDTLADAFAKRVQRLSDAVNAFVWPSSTSPLGSLLTAGRLAVNDSNLGGSVTGMLPDQPTPYFRLFTRGLDKNANASLALGLDPGTYEFRLSHQGETEDLTVALTADSSVGELFDAVAAQINESDLAVQAERIQQGSPHLRVAGQVATGLSLGIGVSPAYGADAPRLADTSGHLLAALNLRENTAGAGAATEQRYDLENLTASHPTSFASKAVDPGAPPGLAAGTYEFNYDYGPDSGSFSLDVFTDDTWGDVLSRFADTANSAQDGFHVDRTRRERLSDLLPGGEWGDLTMQGAALEITAISPKLGERLRLSGADAASSGLLATLRLNATAAPGTDASLRINGQVRTRAPGVFSEDSGRLLLEQTDAAGSGALTVRGAYEEMTGRINEISAAYNDLRSFLLPNQGYFAGDLAADWRAPLQAAPAELDGLGLRQYGKDQLLWFDHDAFFSALGAEPERVRSLLLDEDQGLFTQWAEMGAQTLARPATEALAEASALPDPFRPDLRLRSEAELERRSQLLNLLETDLPDFSVPLGSGLLDRKG